MLLHLPNSHTLPVVDRPVQRTISVPFPPWTSVTELQGFTEEAFSQKDIPTRMRLVNLGGYRMMIKAGCYI